MDMLRYLGWIITPFILMACQKSCIHNKGFIPSEINTSRKVIPVFLSVESYPNERISLTVNRQILYEKVSKDRIDSDGVIVHDTLHFRCLNQDSLLTIHLKATLDEIRLIDTIFQESLNGLEDFEVWVGPPLPLQEAWDNRHLPRGEYAKTYKRKIGLTRNYQKEVIEKLQPHDN
ncbi:MAG: hypothetical protein SF052_13815 [Bacteroidia bacterium]|nr:hypothetical protein [Bacteroidia bacterium]